MLHKGDVEFHLEEDVSGKNGKNKTIKQCLTSFLCEIKAVNSKICYRSSFSTLHNDYPVGFLSYITVTFVFGRRSNQTPFKK